MRWMLLGLLVATSAQARGLLLDAAALPAQTREALQKQIALAKREDAEAFAMAQGLHVTAARADQSRRGRVAPITPMLRAFGQRAALPLIELLAFESPDVSGLKPSAKLSLEMGALQALGRLRDARAEPVLAAIIARPELTGDPLVSAAEALGSLSTDAAVAHLAELAKSGGARAEAAWAGLGKCRRLAAVELLASQLGTVKDLAQFKQVVKMLGRVGNAWAWQTGKVGPAGEEAAVRELAARTLIRAHLTALHPEAVDATAKALLVVDAPTTPSLLIEAREGASATELAALKRLGERFERSPLHR